ncbi:ATP-binding cassette domain-containing protein [Lactobacillaceae bacterium L1_55_11]|nr:ATP-binding cassette domain-containing protein [Lactobacillaceae bacterium L1_55_11]
MQLTHVDFAYGAEQIFTDLNLTIHSGRRYAIFGANGVGKTTLLKIINQDLVVKGQVSGCPDNRMLIDLPVLPLGYLTGEEFVALTLRIKMVGLDIRQLHKLAQHLSLDSTVLSTQILKTYSKGMGFKVLMLIALLVQPDLLLLDEPFTELDLTTNQVLSRLLPTVIPTMVFTTHTPSLACQYADEVLVLAGGGVAGRQLCANFADEVELAAFVEERMTNHEII